MLSPVLMPVRRRLLRGFLLLATCSASMCKEAEDVMAAYKFQTLVPPSNMFTVGSVVAIEDEEANGVTTSRYKLVCGPRAALGSYFAPIASQTMASSLRNSVRNQWKISGAAMDHVKASAQGSSVQSVTASLQNAKLLALSDADVVEGLADRSEECKHAIRMRLEQGYNLTIVAAALVADLTYEVEWKQKTGYDKRARMREMQEVAATLGGGQQRVGMKTIESKGLALGIRTDAFLLALTVPELNRCHKSVIDQAHREREPSARPVRVDSKPDAPLVLPGQGGYVVPEFTYDD